jgi:hypothetical protein
MKRQSSNDSAQRAGYHGGGGVSYSDAGLTEFPDINMGNNLMTPYQNKNP